LLNPQSLRLGIFSLNQKVGKLLTRPFFAPWNKKIKTATPKNSGLIMFLSY